MLGVHKENSMEEFFHKHLIKFTLIVTLPLWVAWAMADEVVGHTEHGVAITKKDLEVRTIRSSVTNVKVIDSRTLRVKTVKAKHYDIELYFCFGIDFAQQFKFDSWGSFTSISRGDKVTPISFGRLGTPCVIKKISEVIPESI